MSDQAWFWSEEWQEREAEASRDYAEGHTHVYRSVEDFLNEVSGPVLFTDDVANLLGWSETAVTEAAADLGLLRLPTTDPAVFVYPDFQFVMPERTIVPGLQPVLMALSAGSDDPWEWAMFLTDDAEPERPIEQLLRGDLAGPISRAVETAAVWSGANDGPDAREIARRLIVVLGGTLVAALAGTRDLTAPQEWARDDGRMPPDAAAKRLFVAYSTWRQVAAAEGDDVARLWFVGGNPWLGDSTPLTAIREDRFKEVHRAAQALVDDTFSG